MLTKPTSFRIRSYVPRGRRTEAQERAYQKLWPVFGLELTDKPINLPKVFGNDAPSFLEIGFGSGQSLLSVAQLQPENNFIGVETHQPGIGALLMGIEKNQVKNLRVYYNDVIDVLNQCIAPESFAGIQIFFPDPWQKRRHSERRLIQPEFINLAISRIKKGGILHLATDWEDYAVHMMRVVSAETRLTNIAGAGRFANERSAKRPVQTKFELRALREGRKIWEIQLISIADFS